MAIDCVERMSYKMSKMKKAKNAIRNDYIAAIISGIVTLIAVVKLSQGKMQSIPRFTLSDVVITFLLAFGIYKKSRACAMLMVLYFLSGKILHYERFLNNPVALITVAFFGYFFIMGVWGTFTYHKLSKLEKQKDY